MNAKTDSILTPDAITLKAPVASQLEPFRLVQEGVVEAVAELEREIDRHYYIERLWRLTGLRSRTARTAKLKYDKIAGQYQEAEAQLSQEDKMLAFVGDEIWFISKSAYLSYYRRALASMIAGLGAGRILEVGAGEMNTLLPVIRLLGDRAEVAVALDISAKRLAVGRRLDEHQRISLCVAANADRMPFPDKSFDIVFTSHCLEQSPELVLEAITEFSRVARKYILLAEPAYELAHSLQRRRIRKLGYARGICSSARRLGFNVVSHQLFPVRAYVNGTALTLIAL